MKLNFHLLFVLNFLSICIYGQIPKANFHSEEHLYYDFEGQVKSCEIRNLDEEGQYHWSILNNVNQDLHYDESGKLIERITYDIDDFLYSDSIFMKTKWTYAYENDELKKVGEIDLASNKMENSWEYKYFGDSITFRIFIKNSKDTTSITKIERTDNQISNYKMDDKGHFSLSKIKEFDDSDKLRSISSFDKNEKLKFLIIYNYDIDSLGNEIMIDHQIELKMKKVHKTISTKNEYGDVVSKIYLNENAGLLAESFYEYEYDKNQNWIKKITKWRSGVNEEYLKHVTTRKIAYN